MKYQIGQQLVCTHKGTWTSITVISRRHIIGSGPAFNEICTVIGYDVIGGIPGLKLEGYEFNSFTGRKAAFTERWFEPLVTDAQLESELESIEQLQTL